MSARADVIVVGGGIIGCAVGAELARRGARVRLFEARTIAAGATFASAGMLAPYTEAHDRGPLFDLTLRSLAMYDDFVARAVEDSGLAVDYRRCGSLEVANDERSAEDLRRTAGAALAGELSWLTPNEVLKLEPALRETIHGALLVAPHGYVAVSSLTDALEWAALRHGAEVETGRHVRSIARRGTTIEVIADDGVVWTAPYVVLAAGSWAGEIEPLEAAATVVRPVRGQLLRLAWKGPPLSHVLWGRDCYLVPWQDGTLLVGATVEDAGFDARTTVAGVRDLLTAACEMLPAAGDATFLEARAGLRPATPDGLPIIGRSARTEGLVYATGHYRNGILLAPLTASVVADLILDGRSDPSLALTTPDRF